MSALVGMERFLLQVLSMELLITLIVVFCSLGIICAVGGSLSTLRLVLLRSRLRRLRAGHPWHDRPDRPDRYCSLIFPPSNHSRTNVRTIPRRG